MVRRGQPSKDAKLPWKYLRGHFEIYSGSDRIDARIFLKKMVLDVRNSNLYIMVEKQLLNSSLREVFYPHLSGFQGNFENF